MKISLYLLLAILGSVTGLAFADSPRGAEVQLTAYKVVFVSTPNGVRENLEPLKQVRPGDTVEYEATYVNGTGQAVHDVNLTIPVPEGGLVYIAGQKSRIANTATADGKLFATLPLTRVEVRPDGQKVTREVPLAEYKALRWSLGDLPDGAKRSVRARMQLPAVAPAAATNR
jgi:hypothetical protein